MRTKAERAAEFARQHGEHKVIREPKEPSEWLIDYEMEHSQQRTSGPDRITYEQQIQYEHYRPWPGCPWPDPWRVCVCDIVARKDLGWDNGDDFVDFPVWGDYCGSKEEALANALAAMSNTMTF